MLIKSLLSTVRALGNTSIEVHEWKESDVRRPRLPNSPNFRTLTTKRSDLSFSGWNLAHAIVKADYLGRRNPTIPGVSFLLQSNNLIDFTKSPIELKVGASKELNDVSLTSLSARVGQGLAILFGHSLGLKFTAHLRSYVRSLPAGNPAAMHAGDAMADFLFADDNRTVLIESKGTFTLQDNDPTTIKAVLKKALTAQVDPWMGHLQPSPQNGYVVYSCLRESSWAHSALSVVDPKSDDGKSANVPFDRENVMRENYGAWLRVMGLPLAAERLTRQPSAVVAARFEERPVSIDFWVYEHEGRHFAVRAEPHVLFPFPFRDEFQAPFMVGIDYSVLSAISAVINRTDDALIDLLGHIPSQVDARQEYVSVFPDGTVLGGLLTAKRPRLEALLL